MYSKCFTTFAFRFFHRSDGVPYKRTQPYRHELYNFTVCTFLFNGIQIERYVVIVYIRIIDVNNK